MNTFYFNTGVKYGVNPYLDKTAKAVDAIGGGLVMVIPFQCDAPEKAKFITGCDNPKLPFTLSIFAGMNPDKIIVREIHNSKMVSKYAYFLLT